MNGQYRIGDIVMNNWILTKKLGEGSFGKVYEIERTDFGETYRAALKIITVPQNNAEIQAALEEGMSPEEAKQYFYSMVEDIVREFALMARVKGTAHVVSYEDHQVVCHEQGLGWDILIRMEKLTPLLAYAYAHPFTRRDVIRLGIHMCKSLELCQKYNIIHRDLKPENIFVSENGDFKLGDFGIARTVEKTMSGLSKKGTYNYMAPEVYKGLEYGFSVDIYSLGIVLYRLLNKNRVPFLPPPPEPLTYSSRERALARRMSGEPFPSPCYGVGRLGEIVRKASAYDPRERYGSPGQMRQELEAILYDAKDASVIYPEGDEMILKENIYATMKQKPGEESRDRADDTEESTLSILGKTGRTGEKAKSQAAEGTRQRNAAAREEDTERTVSVYGPKKESTGAAAGSASGGGAKKGGVIAGGILAAAAVAVTVMLLTKGSGRQAAGDPAIAGTETGTVLASESPGEDPRETAADAYERLKAQAEEQYKKGLLTEALTLMDQALELYPDEQGAQLDYTYFLYRIGEYDSCISYGENDLSLGRSFDADGQSQLNEILGAAYYEKGDYAGAAAYFRLSAAGEEMSESAMRDYAVCLARLGSAAEAKDVLTKLRRQGAGSDVTRYVDGEVNYAAGEYVEAEKIFLEVMEEGEDVFIGQKAFRSLAQLYRDCAAAERLGESPIEGAAVKEARLLLTGIELYGLTYDSSLYEMLGQAAYEACGVAQSLEWDLGQDYRTVALSAFERVIELGMAKDYIYTNLYTIHYELGDYDSAADTLDRMEEFLERSGPSAPNLYVPHALRGILLITLENQKEEPARDYHGAEDEYNRARELASDADDTAYLQQLKSLIEQLKTNGWL